MIPTVIILLQLLALFGLRLPAFGAETIRVAVPLFPLLAFPSFVANEQGFFEKEGLRAEIVRINSTPTTFPSADIRRSRCGHRRAWGTCDSEIAGAGRGYYRKLGERDALHFGDTRGDHGHRAVARKEIGSQPSWEYAVIDHAGYVRGRRTVQRRYHDHAGRRLTGKIGGS